MPKYRTIVAADALSELARLTFSFDMKKHATLVSDKRESIRGPGNYPGATERINMMVRRLKDFRDRGVEIVLTAHEQIEKIYARGGMITKKGETPQEPIAVKGWPDLPGKTCPDEVIRACDNVFRMRLMNDKHFWVAKLEPVGGGGDFYEVKDRFNACAIRNGYLPPSYSELATLASAEPQCFWKPPYIWLVYGPPGIGKTRSLLTFPRPMIIFDIDRGTGSIEREVRDSGGEIVIKQYNSEEMDDYPRYLADLEEAAAS